MTLRMNMVSSSTRQPGMLVDSSPFYSLLDRWKESDIREKKDIFRTVSGLESSWIPESESRVIHSISYIP